MGWTGIHKSLPDTKNMILGEMNFTGNTIKSEVLKSASSGNQFWILRNIAILNTGKQFTTATCILMSHKQGETTYKKMDIDCHPYYYNCPHSWLNQIEPQGQMCFDWINHAKKFHEIKNIEIVPGMIVKQGNYTFTTIEVYTSHFWLVSRNDGKLFKMKNTTIRENLV